MTDPFLILHRVRGEPAFDIATKIECPRCHGVGTPDVPDDWPYRVVGCDECDGIGEWWIIPTSGHRAYPYWYIAVNDLMPESLIGDDESNYYGREETIGEAFKSGRLPMPSPWPDHYPSRLASEPKLDLSSIISALTPSDPEERRF